MLTLQDCQNNRGLIAVARVSPNSQEFTDLVNEACRRLMDYGDWWATVVRARFQLTGNLITWPRWVGTVLAVNSKANHAKVRNSWYEFLPLRPDDYTHMASHYRDHRNMRGDLVVNDVGTAAVFNNVPAGSANYILAYPRNPTSDAGKTLTIWGTDANGWPATETLVMPSSGYVSSTNTYRNIARVLKDVTVDYLDVYQCATATPGTLEDLAHYEPGETRPEYRLSRIDAYQCDGCEPVCVSAMIKRQHIDAVSANDLVSIANLAAIKLMIMSIHKEEASDPAGAQAEAARAIHELNRELENKLPQQQTPIHYDAFCGVGLSKHRMY